MRQTQILRARRRRPAADASPLELPMASAYDTTPAASLVDEIDALLDATATA